MRDAGSSASQGWFARRLRTTYFAPLILVAIAVLIGGIIAQLLALAAALPSSRAAQNRAAGGATADADLARVSLAGALADDGTVYVPPVGESFPLTLGGTLNSTTASERDFRYALGADIAQRIMAHRAAHGPFTAISQLLLVPIAPTTDDCVRLLFTEKEPESLCFEAGDEWLPRLTTSCARDHTATGRLRHIGGPRPLCR